MSNKTIGVVDFEGSLRSHIWDDDLCDLGLRGDNFYTFVSTTTDAEAEKYLLTAMKERRLQAILKMQKEIKQIEEKLTCNG